MIRATAVTRIQDALGFNYTQSDKIALRLQEAQRDLERGKTLPRFLLQEDQTLTLVAGTNTVAKPAGFIRIDDDNPPHYIPSGNDAPYFLQPKRNYREAFEAYYSETPAGPQVVVLRNTVLDFIVTADTNYTITWSYYKAGAVLSTDIENEWLDEVDGAPDWLIGEAGWRMAMDKRDKDAISIFESLRKAGRAACLGEVIASEESLGPIYIGANL